jgi:rubredoxin
MTYLLTFINIQEPIFLTLLTLLIGKSMFDKPTEQPVNKPYRKLQVDDLSIIKVPEKLDYQILITEYIKKNGKPLIPVQRRKNAKVSVPKSMNCPKCGAPSDYLYANNGDKGQYQCKVCSCLFSDKNRF